MKINPNSKCACGSGKKYKKCCLKESDYKKKISRLYAKVKFVNNHILKHSNEPNYLSAKFDETMIFSISCSALSFIRAFLSDNYINKSTAISLRNIIESIALLTMYERNEISASKIELFFEQYKIIEYDMYSNLDTMSKILVDPTKLTNDYDVAKNKFLKHVSEKDFKKIIKSQLPFLCDDKVKFHSIIENYANDLLSFYGLLSTFVHPDIMDTNSLADNYKESSLYLLNFIENIFSRFESKGLADYYTEYNVLFNINEKEHESSKSIYHCLITQIDLLDDVIVLYNNFFEVNCIPSVFFRELKNVLIDVNFDVFHGLTESAKMKFKVIAEMIAFFEVAYFISDPEERIFRNHMIQYNSILALHRLFNQKVSEEVAVKYYEIYKKYSRTQTINIDKFNKAISSNLGGLIDKDGRVITYSKLVKDYFNNTSSYIETNGMKVKLEQLLWISYCESQKMSHSCGYLFFTNSGAWSDSDNMIHFIDASTLFLFKKISTIFRIASAYDNKFLPFNTNLDSILNAWEECISLKQKLMKNEKVNKCI